MTSERLTLFAEILLPIPVPGTFTYRVPYALNDQVRVGQRAVVQFGKTKIMSGLIVALTEKVPSVEVKFLMDLLDDQPEKLLYVSSWRGDAGRVAFRPEAQQRNHRCPFA